VDGTGTEKSIIGGFEKFRNIINRFEQTIFVSK